MEERILTKIETENLPGLPPTTEKLLELEETEVLGIKDGEKLLAYAVLSNPGYGEKRLLNHIYVSDPQDSDSLTQLYSYIKQYCLDIELNRLICRYIDTKAGVNSVHALMMHLPQKPLLLNGHRLVYDMKNAGAGGILAAHPNIKSLLPFVKDSSYVSGPKYNKFFEELRKVGRAPTTITSDTKHDRFFEYRGKIIGYLNGFRAGINTLIITESYVSEKSMQGYALPAMIASLLELMDDEYKKTGSLIVQAYEEPVYRGVLTMLGKPEVDELIFEYVMMF